MCLQSNTSLRMEQTLVPWSENHSFLGLMHFAKITHFFVKQTVSGNAALCLELKPPSLLELRSTLWMRPEPRGPKRRRGRSTGRRKDMAIFAPDWNLRGTEMEAGGG